MSLMTWMMVSRCPHFRTPTSSIVRIWLGYTLRSNTAGCSWTCQVESECFEAADINHVGVALGSRFFTQTFKKRMWHIVWMRPACRFTRAFWWSCAFACWWRSGWMRAIIQSRLYLRWQRAPSYRCSKATATVVVWELLVPYGIWSHGH